jgi:hypothetical protein
VGGVRSSWSGLEVPFSFWLLSDRVAPGGRGGGISVVERELALRTGEGRLGGGISDWG